MSVVRSGAYGRHHQYRLEIMRKLDSKQNTRLQHLPCEGVFSMIDTASRLMFGRGISIPITS